MRVASTTLRSHNVGVSLTGEKRRTTPFKNLTTRELEKIDFHWIGGWNIDAG